MSLLLYPGAFSVHSHSRHLPAQGSLPTSPSVHTAKVSGRRDGCVNETVEHRDRCIYIN